MLSSPLREDTALSDDEWRQRSVDNILALLKANAELRALAVKLSDILAARGGWDANSLDKVAKATRPHAETGGETRELHRRLRRGRNTQANS